MKRRNFIKGALAVGGVFACKGGLTAHALTGVRNLPAVEVKRVLVMFKCHLDVGYTNTQTNVTRQYFNSYYPEAMRIAAAMREAGNDRYVWTTGSWLLYEYLEQATSEQRKHMDNAIIAGDIAWHALPFNWQTEMLDRSMIEGSLGLAKSLDARFGRITRGAKMTDVPGHSRGLIGPLADAGVKFLDIGVNPTSTGPNVPEVFLWKNPEGDSLIMMYHQNDYGGVVQIPGSDLAIAVMVRGDNSGNFSIEEVNKIYLDLRKRFPNANVVAADLNEIALLIDHYRGNLPVLNQEIGDTWIYGVPSDPVKVARYREVARLRQRWIQERRFGIGDPTDLKLLRSLLLAPEHTWGTDTARYLDNNHYKPEDLLKVLDKPGYQTMATSWAEKREDLDDAVKSLPASLGTQAIQCLRDLIPSEPSHAQLRPHDPHSEIQTPHFVLALEPKTGAIQRLYAKSKGREWASVDHPMALFTYQTLSKADYDAFFRAYVVNTAIFGPNGGGFGKPGFSRFEPQSREWHPALQNCWSGRYEEGQRILAALAIEDIETQHSGLVAWPERMYIELLLPDTEPVVHINYYWFNKQANRLPEAMWLTFKPNSTEKRGWMLEKVNQRVSPFDVVRGGNRSMHAVSNALHYRDAQGSLTINTMDAPVVALGVRSPIYFSNDQPELNKGIHFSLFNNGWGTNYIQWFGEDMRFRFTIRAQS